MSDFVPNVLKVWEVVQVFPKYRWFEQVAVVAGSVLLFAWIAANRLRGFPGFWRLLRRFRSYRRSHRIFIVIGFLLLGFWTYTIAIARPPLVSYKLGVSIWPGGFPGSNFEAPGNARVLLAVYNDTDREGELHNIYIEFMTEREYLVGQSAQPARIERSSNPALPKNFALLFYQFDLPLLQKRAFKSVLDLSFRLPPAGEKIPISFTAVASEVAWKRGGWQLVSDGKTLQVVEGPLTR